MLHRDVLSKLIAIVLGFVVPAIGQGVDTSYVTADAVVALVGHPRRLLASPEMEIAPKEVISAAGMKYLGIDPLEVEQLLVISMPPAGDNPPLGIVVRFARPYDRNAILQRFRPAETASVAGKEYHRSAGPLPLGLYLPDERTVVTGFEETVREMLAVTKVDTLLTRQLRAADASHDVLAILAIEPVRQPLRQALAQINVPPPLADFKTLPDHLTVAELRLGLSNKLRAEAILHCVNDRSATEVDRLLNRALELGRMVLLNSVARQQASDDPVEQASARYLQRMADRTLNPLRPARDGSRLTMKFESDLSYATTGVTVALLLPAVQAAREAARRTQSTNNLKQIALGMHNYHDIHGHFPARASFDAKDKPLLSWRVHILPFLEQQALYEQFHLDEPWDSLHNIALADKMPAIYRNPNRGEDNKTNYLVPVGQGTIFEQREEMSLRQIQDGTSKTILAVEANEDQAVIWTRPDDLTYQADRPLAGLGALRPGGFNVALADGAVRFINKEIDLTILKGLFTASGQEVIPRF
jgi:hypothetical protein